MLGDPEGRRLARHRAMLLAEAGKVLQAAEALIRRAGFDADKCHDLIAELAKQEQIELQRSIGRIEPRKRFRKHSSQPLLDRRPRSKLFIDESGKSVVEPINPSFFALGAVAFAEEKVDDYVVAADEIKRQFFGSIDLTFHEPAMRNHDGPYYFGGDTDKQRDFQQAVDYLVRASDFVAFGVGVRKTAFERDFVGAGIDPYLPTDAYSVAIVMLLERYIDFLATQTMPRFGRAIFESQGPLEDVYHQLEFARTLLV
jgi:hypothetical protein